MIPNLHQTQNLRIIKKELLELHRIINKKCKKV